MQIGYGFRPENDAYENAKALQRLLNRGGEICIIAAGVYDVSEILEIGSNTTLRFFSKRKAATSAKQKADGTVSFW